MPRPLNEVIAHLRAVSANPAVHTTLIQIGDVEAICDAAERNDAALGYAQRVATALWEKHWKSAAPDWRVGGDLLAILTQIEAATSDLVRPNG